MAQVINGKMSRWLVIQILNKLDMLKIVFCVWIIYEHNVTRLVGDTYLHFSIDFLVIITGKTAIVLDNGGIY